MGRVHPGHARRSRGTRACAGRSLRHDGGIGGPGRPAPQPCCRSRRRRMDFKGARYRARVGCRTPARRRFFGKCPRGRQRSAVSSNLASVGCKPGLSTTVQSAGITTFWRTSTTGGKARRDGSRAPASKTLIRFPASVRGTRTAAWRSERSWTPFSSVSTA